MFPPRSYFLVWGEEFRTSLCFASLYTVFECVLRLNGCCVWMGCSFCSHAASIRRPMPKVRAKAYVSPNSVCLFGCIFLDILLHALTTTLWNFHKKSFYPKIWELFYIQFAFLFFTHVFFCLSVLKRLYQEILFVCILPRQTEFLF